MGLNSAERRAQGAAATLGAITDAARELFLEKGYFATRVEQIAERADVSPATVYSVAGGKAGLVDRLVAEWGDSPLLPQNFERLRAERDPAAVVRALAASSRRVREEHGDVMRILLRTASNDPRIAEALQVSTSRYRGTLRTIAEHLIDLGVRPPEVGAVTDILWFHFGYNGYFTLVDDNRWTFGQAEKWLTEQCYHALGLS